MISGCLCGNFRPCEIDVKPPPGEYDVASITVIQGCPVVSKRVGLRVRHLSTLLTLKQVSMAPVGSLDSVSELESGAAVSNADGIGWVHTFSRVSAK